jgi:glucose 1-dehydrogenase
MIQLGERKPRRYSINAITVEPMKPGSARYEEVAEPDISEGAVLVEGLAVGVCGTDVEIVEGHQGRHPIL